MHAEQAIASARAGKHLVIEKPIALTWKDAKAVGAAIARAGVHAMVCFELRYSAQFTLVKSLVDQGLLGKLHHAEVDYFHGIGPWYGQFAWNVKKDFGGSSLLTAGCHALDLAAAPDGRASRRGRELLHQVGEQDIQAVPIRHDVRSRSSASRTARVGKVASVIDCLQPYYFHTHLVGSEGSLLDTKFYSSKLKGLVKSEWSHLAVPPVDSGDVKDHPYQPQFQAFVDATRAGKTMPLTDFTTALATHRVVYAADLSAAKGRPVKLASLK